MEDSNFSFLNLITNQMIVNIYLFSMLMKYRVCNICRAALESQCNKANCGKDLIHIMSQRETTMNLYSISAEDREMVCCFLDFQDTKESPRNKQNRVTDFLVSGQAAQSASQKTLRLKSEEAGKNKPRLGANLI